MGTTIEKHNWFYQSLQTTGDVEVETGIFHFDIISNVSNISGCWLLFVIVAFED